MVELKKCALEVCNELFEPTSNRQKYCSDKCARFARIIRGIRNEAKRYFQRLDDYANDLLGIKNE